MKRILKKLVLLVIASILLGCGIKVEDVQTRMEEALHSKYGEEFVVENIGLREANGQKFYQAKIYPKSIIGTEREDDSYYYATSSINLKSPNRLSDGVGDSYWEVKMNDDAEKYLEPKVKEIYGERVRLKAEIKYEKRIEDSEYFAWYKKSDFEEAMEDVKNDAKDEIRLGVTLYVYIFDRIETDEELVGRREETFEFIQYLKREELFEYLEMGVIFVDERVLAPSYEEYEWKLSSGKKEEVKIGEKTVFLPRKEIRDEMAIRLKEEVDRMTEEEMILNMKRIRKSDLSYKGIEKFNTSHVGLFYSVGILKTKYKNSYNKYVESKKIDNYYYNNVNDLIISKDLEYIY